MVVGAACGMSAVQKMVVPGAARWAARSATERSVAAAIRRFVVSEAAGWARRVLAWVLELRT